MREKETVMRLAKPKGKDEAKEPFMKSNQKETTAQRVRKLILASDG